MTLKMLIDNGCIAIVEGTNMPTTPKAKSLFQNKNLLFAPDKAANAGGGRCIGPGNATKRIAAKLELLRSRPTASNHYVHQDYQHFAEKYKRPKDYVFGANVAGFLRVADAVHSYGVI